MDTAPLFTTANQPFLVPREHASQLTTQQFIDRYEAPKKPVIIQGLLDEWPASHKWDPVALLQRLPDTRFKVGADDEGYPVRMKLKHYLMYVADPVHGRSDDSPLYIFDGTFTDKKCARELKAVRSLTCLAESRPLLQPSAPLAGRPKQYPGFAGLRDPALLAGRPAAARRLRPAAAVPLDCDGPRALGVRPAHRPPSHARVERCRARTQALGPLPARHAKRGASLVWACLCMLRQYLCLRSVPAPRCVLESGPTAARRRVQLVLPKEPGLERESVSWFTHVWPRTQRPDWPGPRPLNAVQAPGEVIFVPAGWWHAVLNLDLSIAVTHNYCSSANFDAVWRHARRGRPKMAAKWLARLREVRSSQG